MNRNTLKPSIEKIHISRMQYIYESWIDIFLINEDVVLCNELELLGKYGFDEIKVKE